MKLINLLTYLFFLPVLDVAPDLQQAQFPGHRVEMDFPSTTYESFKQ